MDYPCWISAFLGGVAGVVVTRVWMALDLDHKLPGLRRR